MKPGKPLTFATVTILGKSKLVFGLPGNPVSSLVTFQLFGIPTLRKMCGHATPELTVIHAKVRVIYDRRLFVPNTVLNASQQITKSLKLDPQRPEYHRATVHWDTQSQCFIAASTGACMSNNMVQYRTNKLCI